MRAPITYLAAVVVMAISALPAYAMGEVCPTHGMDMYMAGQTKMEGATLYYLYTCPLGDQWWLPASTTLNVKPPDYSTPRNFYIKPTYTHYQYPCPACGQDTLFTGRTEFIDLKFMNIRTCINGHESAWPMTP